MCGSGSSAGRYPRPSRERSGGACRRTAFGARCSGWQPARHRQERGKLICGVNNQVPGFGNVDANGAYSGFDVDFCKAVAAAVLGDAEAVEYKLRQRQRPLHAGQAPARSTYSSATRPGRTTRDSAEVGMEFMPVNFYDGQGMMVRKDSGIASMEDMDGATVCVQSGTTTELNLADVLPHTAVWNLRRSFSRTTTRPGRL
jgi:general L-amino acid transport system substrate-binding protein